MTSDIKPTFRERVASRQPIECPVVYTDGVFCASGVVKNFTARGIQVQGTRPVQGEMKLVLFFLLPGGAATLQIRKGTVRWIDGSSFGIDLLEVSPASHAELTRLAALHLRSLWANLN
jgi:hypothetical protein